MYLRGLLALIEVVRTTDDLLPLYVGKIAVHHLPFVRELSYRKVLVPEGLQPRYLNSPKAKEKLARIRAGAGLLELVPRPARRNP